MTAQPWLARLPAGLFAIPVGLFGLAGAWRRGQAFEWSLAGPVATAVAAIATAILALLMVLYAAKLLQHLNIGNTAVFRAHGIVRINRCIALVAA